MYVFSLLRHSYLTVQLKTAKITHIPLSSGSRTLRFCTSVHYFHV